MCFISTHPDQSLYFPQYYFIISLPMFLSPQAPCIVLLSCLASVTIHCLISPADFIRMPLLPVSESYTVGTNTFWSDALMDSLPKLISSVHILPQQFLARIQ